jgi:hypothetical protein
MKKLLSYCLLVLIVLLLGVTQSEQAQAVSCHEMINQSENAMECCDIGQCALCIHCNHLVILPNLVLSHNYKNIALPIMACFQYQPWRLSMKIERPPCEKYIS